ncbi:AAA domain-containing protein [Halonotius sp. GCM10025705]|uniref:AAA domain-containing protein n=1 Tax=Halonotius sp. GCM10025705 TaxID=3252678 RepID=UPI00361B5769
MSLLFEHAIEEFSLSSATLVDPQAEHLEPTDQSVPVRPVAEFAGHHDSLSHPTKEWICIPLHGTDSAAPTDEYIGYLDHDLRGELFYIKQNGSEETIAADEFAQTKLANRIRFWHSDYLPETFPPGYDSPINDTEPPRNPVESTTLLDGFDAYIEAERTATQQRNREHAENVAPRSQWAQNEAAIPALHCVEETNGEYEFRLDLPDELKDRRDNDWAYIVENEFDIHEGNDVLLHANWTDPPDSFPVVGTVQRIRGRSLWLSFDWADIDRPASIRSALTQGRECGLSGLLNPVPFDREQEAVKELRDTPTEAILTGNTELTFANSAAAQSTPFDSELNQEQQAAVKYALLADDLFCIHGPPGTGKTRTLIEIIRRAVEAGDDVLVCADSNQAVDNLVAGSSTDGDVDQTSLHAHSQHGEAEFVLDRINADRSARPLIRENYTDVEATPEIVAATNSSAARLHRSFDLVVIDEATQATCTASCIPLSKADRVVLAGDHKQLPPFSSTEEPPDSSYGLSLFEHLYASGGVYEGVGVQLKTQYRMHRDIAYFPNREFYDRSLRNGRRVEPLAERAPIEAYNVGGSVDVVDHSRANPTEAKVVVHLVTQLLAETAIEPADIGVITPYSAQVRTITQSLADAVPEATAISVDTIDAYQGSEKPIIILSLVRSNATGEIGFLGRTPDGPRRLNVALTRGQRYTAVVGDFHTLAYDHESTQTDVYQELHEQFESRGLMNNVDPELLPSSSVFS